MLVVPASRPFLVKKRFFDTILGSCERLRCRGSVIFPDPPRPDERCTRPINNARERVAWDDSRPPLTQHGLLSSVARTALARRCVD